ncbi:MAG: hypothetical protein K0U36_00905 [Alphaproteobacteria bacterium]|nr:hypothetical protein [Alphaproteobacteria bacterium]
MTGMTPENVTALLACMTENYQHFDAIQSLGAPQLEVQNKADFSPVSALDKMVERAIRKHLSQHFPRDGVFGEEYADKHGDSPYAWVIDPVDGTRSLISGSPLYGCLIGRCQHQIPVWGMAGFPALGTTWWNDPNDATLLYEQTPKGTVHSHPQQPLSDNGTLARQPANDLAPTAAKEENIAESLLNHGKVFVLEAEIFVQEYPDLLQRLHEQYRHLRFDHDCYSYIRLIKRQIDGIIECDLKPYDILPLVPLLIAAGCTITDWQGNPLRFDNAHVNKPIAIVASHRDAVHARLIDSLQT